MPFDSLTPSDAVTPIVVCFFCRIIFIGSPIDGRVAQSVISSLVTLATIDAEKDIKIYLNTPGGSTYSVLAIYDAMAWVKCDISTVAFGLAAAQGALLLAAGTKGKRFAMPNARIMIHQPSGGCGGTVDDVRRQVRF
jgi:ATP-dependent Clp protease protease subunit